ncbi:MAG: DUF4124 domain-containing protein [Gammaproteobacteria bacterium]|nr:DUF4124 domain-containing protein [Gammaproteobacteria bacterium]
MKTRWLLLLGCLLAFASQAQEAKKELWKWTDANGVVHYSDVPGPGAVKVDLVISESHPAAAATPPTAAPAAPAAAATGPSYASLEIWQPEQESSFFGADVIVNVRIRSDPGVAPNDRLLLFIDGKRVEGPENSLDYTLGNLDRGAHSLTAMILDTKGKQKIRSQPVVFYIKQVTTIPPAAVGPLLKPKPKGGG